jgi:hypothetical protein
MRVSEEPMWQATDKLALINSIVAHLNAHKELHVSLTNCCNLLVKEFQLQSARITTNNTVYQSASFKTALYKKSLPQLLPITTPYKLTFFFEPSIRKGF